MFFLRSIDLQEIPFSSQTFTVLLRRTNMQKLEKI